MKKLIALVFTLALFTGCENEPLDGDLIGVETPTIPENPNPESESSDLTLALYELDTNISFSFLGLPIQSITNSDINISNNMIVSSNVTFIVQGSDPATETQTITRNTSGQVISDISTTPSGFVTNEYHITYTDNNITQITYNYYDQEDPILNEDYIYNFTYNGNEIKRTKVNSTIETIFTLNASNKLIKKESFDGSTSIQTEELTYNGDGNVSNSVQTGESNSVTSFNYDAFENPLKVIYDEQYFLSFLSDDYDDEIGTSIAHFHSTKNWNNVDIDGNSFDFNLQYNSANRISSRDISYNFGEQLSFVFNERFNYVN